MFINMMDLRIINKGYIIYSVSVCHILSNSDNNTFAYFHANANQNMARLKQTTSSGKTQRSFC